MDFVEICNVCTREAIIKAAKRTFDSDKICRSYCDFYFGVTFLEHSVVTYLLTYCDDNAGSEETSEPKPVPSLLVGYEQEWLSISPHAIRYWVCEPSAYWSSIFARMTITEFPEHP